MNSKQILHEIRQELKDIRRLATSPTVRMLTSNDAARYLGISLKTLREGIGQRGQPKKKLPIKSKFIGSKKLYDVRDLDSYLDSLGE